ncbi:MAG: hypothetical protein QGD88_12355 [Anaerolineae bacterium]|nr:hypothetical protein [Anaerolineae bacterium]
MTSNFEFLQENWSFLLEGAQRVEAFAFRDPRTAAFYARRTLERALGWLYDNDTALNAYSGDSDHLFWFYSIT